MGLLNQQNKKGNKNQPSKNQQQGSSQSKFISKGSKPSSGGVNKKGLTGGSRGS